MIWSTVISFSFYHLCIRKTSLERTPKTLSRSIKNKKIKKPTEKAGTLQNNKNKIMNTHV